MVRLKRILLPCLAVLLIVLSVTGESGCKSSSLLTSSPEERTGRATKPGPLHNRQLRVSFSDTPFLSISRKRKSPFTSSWTVPIRNQQIVLRNNKRLHTPTKNKHKCPFGKKKKVPIKKKKKCSIRRNWAGFTSNKPKSSFSQKVPAKKKKCPLSKTLTVTIKKNPKVTSNNKSKCRIRSYQEVTVRIKAKSPVNKNWAINISNKPTRTFSKHKIATSKTLKCPIRKQHKVSVNKKLKCPLKKTRKVSEKKKAKSPYKRIMKGANRRNPKCPLKNTRKGLVQKKTKRPFIKNTKVHVNKKPKCPLRKYQKVPVKKNGKCPLKKNLPVTIKRNTKRCLSSEKKAKSPPRNKKMVTMIHKQVSFSSVRPKVPLRSEPKLPLGNNRGDSKIKWSVVEKIPSVHGSKSKCPFKTTPFKKPAQPKTNKTVPLSTKPKLSVKEKMDILINYQIRLFIHLKFASCLPCQRRVGLQPLIPPLFPIYFTPSSLQNGLGTPSSSSLFESTICEGNLGQFQCPIGGRIQIESAFYGRQNLQECLSPFMYGKKQNTNCRRDVTKIMSDMCNNRTLCYIYVDNDEMRGDPCPNTYKYMHFTASCV